MQVLVPKEFDNLNQLLNEGNTYVTASGFRYYYLPFYFIKDTNGNMIMKLIDDNNQELNHKLGIK